jgi:DMSO/TMAO reductase YedYZ molybdopterin-dependent catalytic subunit
MKLIFSVIYSLTWIVLLVNTAFSQDNAASLIVGGDVLKPLILSVKELSGLKSSEVKATDRDGKEHTFKGVMLWTILDSAGVTLVGDLRGENLAKYVIVKASDGYEVVFSLPEIDPEFSDKIILLAHEVDGRPLAPTEGPFRLVVPQDKKHARWIRQLTSIQVLFSKN